MNARRNATGRTAEEIREAVATMDTPSYCKWCEQFYDGTSAECHHCNSDDTLSYRDMPWYLECAEEDELHELHAEANRIDEERRYLESA